MKSGYEALEYHVQQTKIIDTHEHVSSPALFENTKRSLLDFIFGTYISDDLESVGLKREIWRSNLNEKEKWQHVSKYLSRVRNTTYYHVLQTVLRDLYGVKEDLLAQDIDRTSSLIQAATARGAKWYDFILHEKCNIELCLIDVGQTTDFEIHLWNSIFPLMNYAKDAPETWTYESFQPVFKMDMFAFAYRPAARPAIEQKLGARVSTFAEFEEILRQRIPALRDSVYVAIKSTLAYFSDLDYSNPDREKAQRAWSKGENADEEDRRCFRDYVVWLFSEIAGEGKLTFQVHTGTLCCGARYCLKTGPEQLVKLIRNNPETKFDLFHAGYPDIDKAAAIVKNLPNAYLNLNWLPIISKSTAERYLCEILDIVPASKITWGGDAVYIEEIYAHTRIMREILTAVLGDKLSKGRYDQDLCKEIAIRILRQNAIDLYQLGANSE